uniref:Uncharacterized protein n=1 Tax=Plectus sambesii TaxID=2011161 RepID=A0A914VEN1_9BILA
MSGPWIKNFVGVRQSDLELLQVPNPKLELGLHVTIKTVQTGTLIGTLVGPLVQAYKGARDNDTLIQAAINGGWIGAGVGLVAGPLLAIQHIHSLGTIRTYDRCYRLRFDGKQLRADRLFAVAAAAGYAISGPAGFVLGVDLAALASGALNAILK